MKKLILITCTLALLPVLSHAETELVDDEVVIDPRGKKSAEQTVIEEFEENGVRYIKVTPKKGPSYYLIDSDGDGDMDTRRNELDPNLLIPSWTLFTW